MNHPRHYPTRWLLLVILFALPILACETVSGILPGNESGEQPAVQPARYILFWRLFDDNRESVSPELMIFDAGGQNLASVPWPDPDEAGSLMIYDSPADDQALLYGNGDEASFYLVDLPEGTTRRLDTPASLTDSVVPLPALGGAAGDWLALGTPRGDELALLDAAGGRIIDLLTLKPEMEPTFSGRFNQDGSYYLAFGSDTWLVPTADPAAARRLGGEGPGAVMPGTFSADGRSIVFGRYLRDQGHTEIVVEELASGTLKTVSTRDGLHSAAFIPDSDRILLLGEDLAVIGPDGEEEWTATGTACQGLLFFGPAGSTAVCEAEDGWTFVDLAGGQTTALPALEGFSPRTGRLRDENHWLVFIADDERQMVALDLSDGRVTELLSARPDQGQLAPYLFPSQDGRYVVANILAGDSDDGQTWLLDVSNPDGHQVRSMPGAVPATIAPDSCCLVVYHQGQLMRQELVSGEETPLGPGAFVNWVR